MHGWHTLPTTIFSLSSLMHFAENFSFSLTMRQTNTPCSIASSQKAVLFHRPFHQERGLTLGCRHCLPDSWIHSQRNTRRCSINSNSQATLPLVSINEKFVAGSAHILSDKVSTTTKLLSTTPGDAILPFHQPLLKSPIKACAF